MGGPGTTGISNKIDRKKTFNQHFWETTEKGKLYEGTAFLKEQFVIFNGNDMHYKQII